MSLHPIAEIIAELKAGQMVVLVDEEDRENEGDLVLAADFVTPEAINFMAKHGRGLICLTLTEARCRQLNLPLMVRDNRSPLGTNFTVVHRGGNRRHDRHLGAGPRTHGQGRRGAECQARGHRPARPHFPADGAGGRRAGARRAIPRAGCDLASLAGLTPAAVICEILKDDGTMARLPDLIDFAERHGLRIGSIADLIHFRSQNESLIKRVTERVIQTRFGPFRLVAFLEKLAGETHLALVRGEIAPESETLVRVHEPLSLLDLLDTGAGTHSWSVHETLEKIASEGRGVMVLLNCTESAGQLIERVASPGRPKTPGKMDLRTYGIGAQILRDLGVRKMRLMAAPRKMPSMAGWELEIAGYVQPAKQDG